MKAKFKKIYQIITGRYNHIKRGIDCKNSWYGNQYGGFYVIPDLLDKKSIVYSFGIGEDISFDSDIIDHHGCKVFGFDPTPKSISWCRNHVLPENFHFYDYGIAKNTGKTQFHLPKNRRHVSGSIIIHNNVSDDSVEVNMKSFTDIIKGLDHDKIDILKMDIEGSEYDVLDSILRSNVCIDQLAIEFHEQLFDDGKKKTIQAIKNLEKNGYKIFAISNTFKEISFVRLNAM